MVMKRILVVSLAAFSVLSSCSLFKGEDFSEKKKEITATKDSAISAINDAQTKAVNDAQESIRSIIASAVEGASEDISSTINDAKNEIQKSAEESVSQTLNEKLNAFNSELAKAHRNAGIAAIIALVSLILGIVSFVLLIRWTKRDEIIKTIKGSWRIKEMINSAIDEKINDEDDPCIKQRTSKSIIENEIKRYLGSPAAKQFITSLIASQEKGQKDVQGLGVSRINEIIGVQDTASSIPRVEFYATDSPDDVLSGVTNTYQQGISIYRLIMDSSDAQVAEVSVCIDKEQVKSRILKSSNDLLEPVCRVDRKRINPGNLSSISIRPGKAERLSSDTWKVVEPITVEIR